MYAWSGPLTLHEAAGLSSASATSTLLYYNPNLYVLTVAGKTTKVHMVLALEYKGKGIPGSHL